jgi:hypothetical protein
LGIVIRKLCRERFVGLLSEFVTYLHFTASNITLVSRGRLERTCEDTVIYHNALSGIFVKSLGSFTKKKSPKIDKSLGKNGNREISSIKQQL